MLDLVAEDIGGGLVMRRSSGMLDDPFTRAIGPWLETVVCERLLRVL